MTGNKTFPDWYENLDDNIEEIYLDGDSSEEEDSESENSEDDIDLDLEEVNLEGGIKNLMNEGVIQQVGSPSEIYNQPDNIFVAVFIGNPAMNLINGILIILGFRILTFKISLLLKSAN